MVDGASYVALIGDIRSSREIEERAQVQDELRAALGELNDGVLEGPIEADLVITAGDEFQGLFATPGGAIEAMGRLDERFPGLSFAFGIGVGPLDTGLREQAVGMDGPCFHEARHALDHAEKQPAGARVSGFGETADRHANAVAGLVAAVRSDWTATQCRYALALRDAATQQAVADRFDRSKSSVSESLSAAHVRKVHQAETELARYLHRRMRGAEEGTT